MCIYIIGQLFCLLFNNFIVNRLLVIVIGHCHPFLVYAMAIAVWQGSCGRSLICHLLYKAANKVLKPSLIGGRNTRLRVSSQPSCSVHCINSMYRTASRSMDRPDENVSAEYNSGYQHRNDEGSITRSYRVYMPGHCKLDM